MLETSTAAEGDDDSVAATACHLVRMLPIFLFFSPLLYFANITRAMVWPVADAAGCVLFQIIPNGPSRQASLRGHRARVVDGGVGAAVDAFEACLDGVVVTSGQTPLQNIFTLYDEVLMRAGGDGSARVDLIDRTDPSSELRTSATAAIYPI